MSTNNPMSNIPPLGPPTGMMPGSGPGKFKPIDPIRVLRANWLWILFAAVIGGGLGTGTYYLLDKFMPAYTSEAQFKVDSIEIDPTTGRKTRTTRMSDLEPLINSEVQRILGETILRTILNTPGVQGTTWFARFDGDLDKALEDLNDNVLSAGHIRETQLFAAKATTRDEDDAIIILTALYDEYMKQVRSQSSYLADQEMQAAIRQLNAAEAQVQKVTGDITRFLTTNPLESLQETTTRAAQEVGRLVIKKSELEESFNSLGATYNQLKARLDAGNFDPSDEERQLIENGPEIVNIDGQLRELRVSRESQLARFGEQHPVIRQIDERILSLQRERDEEFDNQARVLFNAKLEQAALGQQILTEELSKVDESLAEWTAKRQDTVQLLQAYQTLQREQEVAEDQKAAADDLIKNLLRLEDSRLEVSVRTMPTKAKQTFPWDWYITIGGVGFLFTSFVTGLIFLRELLDQRVRSAADVKMIPDASLVGMIPDADEDRAGGQTIERVVENHPAGLLAEAFRQVRTAVLSKMDRRGYKTLMLVSAKPEAGVTAIAQNLGTSCALSGRRVLIIDANFRRPGMARLMGLPEQPGLADVLCGDHDMDALGALAHETQTRGLSVLPAGNTAKAAVELFENPRFRELMGRLESEYDLLIIDAPPALLTSDAQLLSRHVDAMVLVSRARTDTRGMLQRVYRELDGQRADILGIVLNGVQSSAGGYLKRNFQEFHAYSGPERRNQDRPAVARTAAATAVGAAATNGLAAETNGSAHQDAPAAMPLEMVEQGDDEDDDVFGGFDLTDSDDEQDK